MQRPGPTRATFRSPAPHCRIIPMPSVKRHGLHVARGCLQDNSGLAQRQLLLLPLWRYERRARQRHLPRHLHHGLQLLHLFPIVLLPLLLRRQRRSRKLLLRHHRLPHHGLLRPLSASTPTQVLAFPMSHLLCHLSRLHREIFHPHPPVSQQSPRVFRPLFPLVLRPRLVSRPLHPLQPPKPPRLRFPCSSRSHRTRCLRKRKLSWKISALVGREMLPLLSKAHSPISTACFSHSTMTPSLEGSASIWTPSLPVTCKMTRSPCLSSTQTPAYRSAAVSLTYSRHCGRVVKLRQVL